MSVRFKCILLLYDISPFSIVPLVIGVLGFFEKRFSGSIYPQGRVMAVALGGKVLAIDVR